MNAPQQQLLALAAVVAVWALVPPDRAAQGQEAPDGLRLVDAFPGATFSRPVYAAQPPDGTDRMFVVEQAGRIHWVRDPAAAPGGPPPTRHLFLDIADDVSRQGNEEGLLGLAFHPDYATNGRFFVHYSAAYTRSADRRNVLAEYRVSADDDGVADPTSFRSLLEVSQPFSNHNGGMIEFGPDGLLYVGLGDGGSGGDPRDNGQDLGTLLGSLLRVDVDAPGVDYAVPATNPFRARAGARGEIWAYGLRNPWRFSFDRATGDCWVGDVGQNAFEEIDVVQAGDNLGWRRREGLVTFNSSAHPLVDPVVDPVAVYGRGAGRSVTGGYVYRGTAIPSLAGSYLYADFVSGRMWRLVPDAGLTGPPRSADDVTVSVLMDSGQQIASFAQDRAGELYVCTFGGRVMKLVADEEPVDPPPPVEEPLPVLLSQTGLFASTASHTPVPAALPYRVRAQLWSDRALKDRFLVLPPGESLAYQDVDAFDLPVGGWAVKTFSLRDPSGKRRRLETRVILRTEERFEAATYRWNAGQTDATRLDARVVVDELGRKGLQSWTYPSPQDCRSCHTDAAGFLLGVRARQLRRVESGRRAKRLGSLLDEWFERGLLTGDVPLADEVPRNLPIKAPRRIEQRVRSYLNANCASCHRPGGAEDAGLDLRAETPLEETGLIGAAPQRGSLGIDDAQVVWPGRPRRSVLLERMRTTGDKRMPTLGSAVPHARAIKLVERWIKRMRPAK